MTLAWVFDDFDVFQGYENNFFYFYTNLFFF